MYTYVELEANTGHMQDHFCSSQFLMVEDNKEVCCRRSLVRSLYTILFVLF